MFHYRPTQVGGSRRKLTVQHRLHVRLLLPGGDAHRPLRDTAPHAHPRVAEEHLHGLPRRADGIDAHRLLPRQHGLVERGDVCPEPLDFVLVHAPVQRVGQHVEREHSRDAENPLRVHGRHERCHLVVKVRGQQAALLRHHLSRLALQMRQVRAVLLPVVHVPVRVRSRSFTELGLGALHSKRNGGAGPRHHKFLSGEEPPPVRLQNWVHRIGYWIVHGLFFGS